MHNRGMTDYPLPPNEQHIAQPLAPARYPLVRPYQQRVFAGVCQGLAMHLGVKTWIIRLIFVTTSFIFGLGIAAYLFLWIAVPAQNLATMHVNMLAPSQSALSKGNNASYLVSAPPNQYEYVATQYMPAQYSAPEQNNQQSHSGLAWNILASILAGIFVIYLGFNWAIDHHLLSPMLAIEISVGALCALVAWLYSERFHKMNIAVIVGILLVFVAAVFALCTIFFKKNDYLHVYGIFLIGIFSVAITTAPLLAQYHQNLLQESAQKQREEERADMAAHLHDSVLQTLNLIRQNAHNADYVSQLARTQERELRRWLYEDRENVSDSVASSMKLISAQIEDTHGVPIDVITVGDCEPNERISALIDATRQALTNACLHGKPAISLYVECGSHDISVFVRDHGDGFNLDDIPQDRMGIRHSIQGRMERAGGTVEIVSRPQWGTEVRMTLPLEEKK